VAVEDRLDPSELPPYAVTTARNMVRSLARHEERRRRHAHRLADLRQPADPEARALEEEDRRALAAALARLPPQERESIVAHDVDGMDTTALAERLGTTPGAVATRLSRARARLRVEYLLALRRVDLPTPMCKPVLLALSAGLKRDQRALGAGEHLLACPTCSALSEPLVQRRRPLAALWPFLGLDQLFRWLRRTARAHPAPAAAATAATVAVLAAVVLAPDDRPPPTLIVRSTRPVPLAGSEPLAPHAGRTVEARGVRVQSVPEPRGLWVGSSQSDRVWVDLHEQAELSPPLVAGERVSFLGRLVANTPETLERAGQGGPEDRAQLEQQGYHVDVVDQTLRRA
jgi:RNA polymerase sigma factor (sigma-70 family)